MSILQATFADAGRAQAFWRAASALLAELAGAPGFIRRYSFADGPSITLIALWRSAADAHAFATGPKHRAATRDLYRQRWQYSHFAAVWEAAERRPRVVFCEQCDGVTPLPAGGCTTCGAPIVDVYAAG